MYTPIQNKIAKCKQKCRKGISIYIQRSMSSSVVYWILQRYSSLKENFSMSVSNAGIFSSLCFCRYWAMSEWFRIIYIGIWSEDTLRGPGICLENTSAFKEKIQVTTIYCMVKKLCSRTLLVTLMNILVHNIVYDCSKMGQVKDIYVQLWHVCKQACDLCNTT